MRKTYDFYIEHLSMPEEHDSYITTPIEEHNRQAHCDLRRDLRDLLCLWGTRSNPGWTDNNILDFLSELLDIKSPKPPWDHIESWEQHAQAFRAALVKIIAATRMELYRKEEMLIQLEEKLESPPSSPLPQTQKSPWDPADTL